jgi:acetyl esterase
MLDPQAAYLLKLLVDNHIPSVHTQTPEQARDAYRTRRGFSQPEPPQVGPVEDHVVHANGASFKVRSYQPPGRSAQALPALVYYHGGGWTIGDLDTHDVLCRSLCLQAGVVVVSVDYRMGPEHKFPAAYLDSIAAFEWVQQQAKALGIRPDRVAVGGDSAGGNLAAAVCLGLRESAQAPAFQLLIYPATNMHMVTASHTSNAEGYLLTRDAMAWFQHNYLGSAQDADDWRASPLLAKSHAQLPAALVLTAGFDPLRDEGLQYADALTQAGVPCQYVCFERQIHGFITMGRILTEANTAVTLCAQVLRQAMST